MDNLQDKVVCGTEFGCINSSEYYDCCVHCICLRGNAKFKYFGNDFELKANSMAVLSYPQHISGIETSADFDCEYVIASGDFLQGLLPANNYSIPGSISLTRNPIMNMTTSDMSRMHEDFQGIVRRIGNTGHLFYLEMLGSLLRTMIYDIFDIHARRDGNEAQTSGAGYVVTHFISMIREGHPAVHRSPRWYADKLNITVKYMGDTVKRITGASVSDHISRAAAAKLREYIENTYLSMTEIAEIMNFNSLSYLNRFCKRHLGKSPTELRRVNGNVKSTL